MNTLNLTKIIHIYAIISVKCIHGLHWNHGCIETIKKSNVWYIWYSNLKVKYFRKGIFGDQHTYTHHINTRMCTILWFLIYIIELDKRVSQLFTTRPSFDNLLHYYIICIHDRKSKIKNCAHRRKARVVNNNIEIQYYDNGISLGPHCRALILTTDYYIQHRIYLTYYLHLQIITTQLIINNIGKQSMIILCR